MTYIVIIIILIIVLLYFWHGGFERFLPIAVTEWQADELTILPDLINLVKAQTPGAIGVDLYFYYGRNVLLVTVECCDFFAQVFDMNGIYMGAPYGGITGHGDNKLPDWFANADFVKNIA